MSDPPYILTMTQTQEAQDYGSLWREEWANAQALKGPGLKNGSTFYRNIEEELDRERKIQNALPLHLPSHTIDFSTCDVLGMSHNGDLREEFLKELEANPGFSMGAGGSRLCDGTTRYHDTFERELAELMGTESALFVHNGWTANYAIFSTIPRSGDVIVFDELMHATALAGMKVSLALEQKPFRHNDVDDFIEILEDVKENFPLIRDGKKCVLIAVESYYSMDGDMCPLKELIDAANDIFPLGNAQFIVDEAHSFGIMGPDGGLGFVRELGLDDQVAVRMFTFGKALASSGGMSLLIAMTFLGLSLIFLGAIISNNTVRSLLINQAKVFICSIAPPFPLVAAARAGIRLVQTEKFQKASYPPASQY